MRWFRRRGDAPTPPAPGRHDGPKWATPDDISWRSYDTIAEEYARISAPQTARIAADLVDMVGVRPGQRVLDVGTGTGVAARAAAAAGDGHLVVGIDPSVPMLLAGRTAAAAGPRFAAAEAIDLPFADQRFDVVLCTFALFGFPKYDTALFDMLRVLKGGGRLGVTTWGSSDDEFKRAWNEVAEEFVEHDMLVSARGEVMPWLERFSDPGRLKDALYEAGLRHIRVERREYQFEISAQDYLTDAETSSAGRFIRQMLGDTVMERFRSRAAAVFAERFPPVFNDFQDAILAVGTKP
jgi:ubiquinone/menaquinone biosynthesis C-methylase UbiE